MKTDVDHAGRPTDRHSHSWDGIDNADGTINTHHHVFQQGRNLYDCQCLLADLDAGKEITEERRELIRKLLVEMCFLINGVGQLRAEYGRLIEDKQRLLARIEKALVGKTP